MQSAREMVCSKIGWRGREAYVLSNGRVRLVELTGGGHIAEFCFTESSGLPTLSPLWVPQWNTIEPYQYREKIHAARFGPLLSGKLISGIVGHNICLDYFGVPSEEEAAQGLSFHGEAPCVRWRKNNASVSPRRLRLTLSARLPVAGLRFDREISLRKGESVAYIKETVTNEKKADHFFHWTQHVTLSPPFLAPGESLVAVSATKGKTSTNDYDGKSLLKLGREFRWPLAPTATGAHVDLTKPFSRRGTGFVTSALLDPKREIEFVTALNLRHHLLVGYAFRRIDFPWIAVWEENRARMDSPWSGRCQARGLEFGSTPFPVTRREAFAAGPLFNTPTFSTVPARGKKTISYVVFLVQVPSDFSYLEDLRVDAEGISIYEAKRRQAVRLAASGLATVGLS